MLTPKQLRCLELLASGVNQKAIAEELGINTRTIQRWMRVGEFQDALNGVPYRSVEVATVERVNPYQERRERLERLMDKAVDVLEETLDNPDARTADKLKAAQMIGEWSGACKVETLDLIDCYQKLMSFDLIPKDSVDKIIEAYDAMKGIMIQTLNQKSLS